MEIKNLSKSFSTPTGQLDVFEQFNLELPEREITAILGPSGCGKTTLLNILAGFLRQEEGEIIGRPKRVSYLFQEPRLLPWRTVEHNIRLVLQGEGSEPEKQIEAAEHYLELVGLGAFGNYYPHELSGGMRQRAAIARAFASHSQMLLMDEPFQALDLDLRISLVNSFIRLWEEYPKTTVFVTHDIQEALIVADQIVVFSRVPASILGTFRITQSRRERSLSAPELISVEQKVVELLLRKDQS